MAAGIYAMHDTGMAALDLQPGIVWHVPMVLASVAIAWGASAAVCRSAGGLSGQPLAAVVAAAVLLLLGGERLAVLVLDLAADEFVLMVESPDAESAAVALAQRILDALRRPVTPGGQAVALSCSIGVAAFPDHDDAGARLLACADAAMDAAKRAGSGTCVVYAPGMAGDAADQVQLQLALRNAIERGELMLYYQPKLDAHQGKLHGLEALLRWRHPARGLVSPAVFVPLAERFGLIGAIGNWVIDEACAPLARWHAQGLQCRVAVNLSPDQLRRPDLPMRIRDALEPTPRSCSTRWCAWPTRCAWRWRPRAWRPRPRPAR